MRNPARALLLLLCVVGMAPALAEDVTPASVREMMERSGLVAQWRNTGEEMRQAFPEMIRGQLPAELADAVEPLSDIVGEAMDGARLLDQMEATLVDFLSPEHLDALYAFCDTPLGRRVFSVETAVPPSEALRQIAGKEGALVAELEKNQPRRFAAFTQLDKALHASELNTTLTIKMMSAIILGVTESIDAESVPAMREKILRDIESSRPKILEATRTQVLALLAWTYKDLTDEEVLEYMEYHQTAAVLALQAAIFSAVTEFYSDAWRQVGKGMVTLLKQKKS